MMRYLIAKSIPQVAARHAPRLSDRGVAPGQQYIPKMSAPGEAGEIRNQKFASPNSAVGPKSSAVQGHPQNLAAQVIFRHATRDVRMVMLHADLVLDS